MEQIPDLTSDISRYHHTSHGFRALVDNHQRTCSHRPRFQSAIASPQFACAAHIAVHIQVSGWRAWRADGACMIDVPAVPTLAEVLDSALQSGKEAPCLGHCMQCTKYMVQRSAGRGRGSHMVPNPHRRAEVFGALLEIAPGPWRVNVASPSAAKPHAPLPSFRCQSILAACSRGGTTIMERPLEKHCGS